MFTVNCCSTNALVIGRRPVVTAVGDGRSGKIVSIVRYALFLNQEHHENNL